MPEIQRRTHRLVASDQMIGLREPDDPRGDQCHGRVAEVTEQRLQPATARDHVGVQERDIAGLAGGEAGIAGRGRTLALRVPQNLDVGVHPGEIFAPDRRSTIRRPR